MSKHSPSPWIRVVDQNGEVAIRDSDGTALCALSGNANDGSNGRLMAAAPTMLEALRAAYSDIQRLPGHTIDMLGRIEAAIAKVEGE